nr:MAG TPA: hypothetical protein [Caudoviricetes sp.]
MKEYKVEVIEEFDNYLDMARYQEIISPEGKTIYSVCSLEECPEDAIIGRCLMSAGEYIDILNAGIKLAKQGYDKVTCTYRDE